MAAEARAETAEKGETRAAGIPEAAVAARLRYASARPCLRRSRWGAAARVRTDSDAGHAARFPFTEVQDVLTVLRAGARGKVTGRPNDGTNA